MRGWWKVSLVHTVEAESVEAKVRMEHTAHCKIRLEIVGVCEWPRSINRASDAHERYRRMTRKPGDRTVI